MIGRPALLLGLAIPLHAAPAQDAFTVGDASALPGHAASGWIAVPALAGDTGTRIPVTVLHGGRPGPVLALIAGTHGAEVAPIVALQRVRQAVDPRRLAGTLVLVHVANPPSFFGRTIYYGPDGRNLNRVYPGRADGTISARIAHAITREVLRRADYVVDMHAGDGNESLRPYAYWMPLGLDARVDSLSREMTRAFGAELVVVDTTRQRDLDSSVYTSNTALILGRPAITTENGWLGIADSAMVARNVDGALRLLRWLGMWPGPVRLSDPVWITRAEVLRSPASGVWHPAVTRDQRVEAGALVGRLTDVFGGDPVEVRAPFAGRVLYVVATPATSRGEPLGMIGADR